MFILRSLLQKSSPLPRQEGFCSDIQIPSEIALHIFGFLSPKDLATCSLVCKVWREAAIDNHLWRMHCQNERLPALKGDEVQGGWQRHYASCSPGVVRKNRYKKEERVSKPLKELFAQKSSTNVGHLQDVWHKQEIAFQCLPNGRIQLWNMETLECQAAIDQSCNAVDFDRHSIVTMQKNDKVYLICEQKRETQETLKHSFEIAYFNDLHLKGEHLYIASGKKVHIIDRHSESDMTLRFQQNIELVAEENPLLWAASSQTLFGHDLRAAPSQTIFSLSLAGTIPKAWAGEIDSLVMQGDYLIAADFRRNMIWDLRTCQRIHLFEAPRGPVSTDVQGRVLARSQSTESASFFFSDTLVRSVTLLNVETGEAFLSLPTQSRYYQIQFIGSSIYCLTEKGILDVWRP